MKLIPNEYHSHYAKEHFITNEHVPFFLCNWVNFVFIHYEVDKGLLQQDVPYKLDLYENKAYISLVAFTLEDFRFFRGGRLTRWITAPVSTQHYFNVRTYVHHQQKNGIYFIKEWMSNKLCSLIASNLYRLPCQYGKLTYNNKLENSSLKGQVIVHDIAGKYQYQMKSEKYGGLKLAAQSSLDEYLLERYIAFVKGKKHGKYFRIWHKPWMQKNILIDTIEDNLITQIGPWGKNMNYKCAHYSPGVYGVWMGKSRKVE